MFLFVCLFVHVTSPASRYLKLWSVHGSEVTSLGIQPIYVHSLMEHKASRNRIIKHKKLGVDIDFILRAWMVLREKYDHSCLDAQLKMD